MNQAFLKLIVTKSYSAKSILLNKAKILYDDSDYTAAEVCKTFGIGRRTFFKYLEEMNQAELESKEQPSPAESFSENEF